jgi:hypothetical protein
MPARRTRPQTIGCYLYQWGCSFRTRSLLNMARVFITGSSDGLGRMAAQLLIEQGHNVTGVNLPPK